MVLRRTELKLFITCFSCVCMCVCVPLLVWKAEDLHYVVLGVQCVPTALVLSLGR